MRPNRVSSGLNSAGSLGSPASGVEEIEHIGEEEQRRHAAWSERVGAPEPAAAVLLLGRAPKRPVPIRPEFVDQNLYPNDMKICRELPWRAVKVR